MSKKNLLFHCYLRNLETLDDTTLFHVKCIEKYQHLFDGKKIVYVAVDDTNVSIGLLLSRFKFFGLFDKICIFKNHEINRESETLIEMLKDVRSNDRSITFYAHNKGSTHQLDSILKKWILYMYFFNLENSYTSKIQDLLHDDYVTCGVMKKNCSYHSHGASSDWHYSGAFFWFSQKLFEYDWHTFDKGRMSLEFYLGQRIPTEKAHSAFINRDYNFGIDQSLWEEELSVEKLGVDVVEKFNSLMHQTYQ